VDLDPRTRQRLRRITEQVINSSSDKTSPVGAAMLSNRAVGGQARAARRDTSSARARTSGADRPAAARPAQMSSASAGSRRPGPAEGRTVRSGQFDAQGDADARVQKGPHERFGLRELEGSVT
jgi:hypothetical protein